VLPPDRFNFANADVTLNIARQPAGEWIGLDSSTTICANGRGCTVTQMHDEAGQFGMATQTLLIAAR
jgi:acyl-CoA thioesterase